MRRRGRKMSEAERQRIYGEYGQFGQQIKDTGHYLAGAQLQPTTTATSVRVRDGKRLVTDGPFAETREQLGGYYLVEAKDLDEAIGIAARIPSAKGWDDRGPAGGRDGAASRRSRADARQLVNWRVWELAN